MSNNQNSDKSSSNTSADILLYSELEKNILKIRQLFGNSSDFLDRQIEICGTKAALIMCEGMVSSQVYSEMLAEPLTNLKLEKNGAEALAEWIRSRSILAAEQREFSTFNELFRYIMSGFVVILIDGINYGTACGLQGFQYRSVSEPSSEMNLRGSREAFAEPIRINQSLIRRRIKSPTLRFELFPIGQKSQTDISLIYLSDRVSPKLLREVKYRLSKVTPDVILNAGYIQPFLEERPFSFFSEINVTERPDTLCAKINEGRIGILVDGTPFALIVPYFFSENFQSMDDYAYHPFYAAFIRCLKYLSFIISIMLPGIYVAVATFHPELLPSALMFNIAVSEETAPFPLIAEALIIHLIYEIMREAGLRLPKGIGHAVGIVGGLVIGDAAVTSGLIGAPMVMVVALTAISSFVIPTLYETVAILKFLFILIGGSLGLFGISLGFAAVLMNICSVNYFGIPYSAPISPFSAAAMRDVIYRESWKNLGKKVFRVQDAPGSDMKYKGV
ncbi:MAG: spore germination protein [Oscillospiraceae bacterium]|nr:spore germination protein [Oscillospiraceae bacterium]